MKKLGVWLGNWVTAEQSQALWQAPDANRLKSKGDRALLSVLLAGSELEQIQFLLGHVSMPTTERYLGCKQRIRGAVNDLIGIEPTN